MFLSFTKKFTHAIDVPLFIKLLPQETYVTSSKRDKMAISRSIVTGIRTMKSPPGRFLEKDPNTGLWHDVGDKKAIEKTSQALRDGAADLRKELSKDLGDPDILSNVFDPDAQPAPKGKKDDNHRSKPPKPEKSKTTKKEQHSNTATKSDNKPNVVRSSSPDTKATTSFVGNTAVIASHDSVEGVLMSPPHQPSAANSQPCSPATSEGHAHYGHGYPPPAYHQPHHRHHPVSPAFQSPTYDSSPPRNHTFRERHSYDSDEYRHHRYPEERPYYRPRANDPYSRYEHPDHSAVSRTESTVSEPGHPNRTAFAPYGSSAIIRSESYDGHPYRYSEQPPHPYENGDHHHYYSEYEQRHHPLVSPPRSYGPPYGPPHGPPHDQPSWPGHSYPPTHPGVPASSLSPPPPRSSYSPVPPPHPHDSYRHGEDRYHRPPPVNCPSYGYHTPQPPRWWTSSNPYRTGPDGQLYIPSLQHSAGHKPDYDRTQREHYMRTPTSNAKDFVPPVTPDTSFGPVPRPLKVIVPREASEDSDENQLPAEEERPEIEPTRSSVSVGSAMSEGGASDNMSTTSDNNSVGKKSDDQTDLNYKKIEDIDNDCDSFDYSPLPYDSDRKFLDVPDSLMVEMPMPGEDSPKTLEFFQV